MFFPFFVAASKLKEMTVAVVPVLADERAWIVYSTIYFFSFPVKIVRGKSILKPRVPLSS